MLSHAVNLKTKTDNPDKSERIIFHVQMNVDGEELDVTLVHLSYNRQQQCQNAVDVINYLASVGSERSVVLGDFNAYEDFPWPVTAILKGSFAADGACIPDKFFDPQDAGRGYGYVDAWQVSHSNEKGYTFSNMVSVVY
jgi:endonuclease/exonuclease/phosphatase family metal-dependent hydrolase